MSLSSPKAVLKSSGTAWILEQFPKGMTWCREIQQGGNGMGWGCKPEGQWSPKGELKVKLMVLAAVAVRVELDLAALWSKVSSLCLCLTAPSVLKGMPDASTGKSPSYDLSHRMFLFRVELVRVSIEDSFEKGRRRLYLEQEVFASGEGFLCFSSLVHSSDNKHTICRLAIRAVEKNTGERAMGRAREWGRLLRESNQRRSLIR